MKDLVWPWLKAEKKNLNSYSQEYLIHIFGVDSLCELIYIVLHKDVNGCYEYMFTLLDEESYMSFLNGLKRRKSTYEFIV